MLSVKMESSFQKAVRLGTRRRRSRRKRTKQVFGPVSSQAPKVQVLTGNVSRGVFSTCLPTPKKELPGQKISKSVESVLQADSDSPRGEGGPIVGCPLSL